MRVAVIGGGPAGLVTLKHLLVAHRYLSTTPIEVWLFEKESSIGGTFQYRAYEDAELVSSRFLTAFSDFRFSDEYPDFVSTDAYCEYLRNYCTHFGLWPRIRLETTVLSIKRNDDGSHEVRFRNNTSSMEDYWCCDAVAICSGLNITPNLPLIQGLEHVPTVFHSSSFKVREQFGENKHVLILGAGETAMDVAHLAVTSPTSSVTLCHRGGWKSSPKKIPDPIFNGNVENWVKDIERNGVSPPTDTVYASLFDSAYVHPIIQRSAWSWNYYDRLAWCYSWLISGAGTGPDQFVGEIQGARHHASRAIAMKSNKAQAYISAPYRPEPNIVEKMRISLVNVPLPDTKGRQIDVAPWPDHIDTEGLVHFRDNRRPEYESMKGKQCKPDIVICATGYTQVFPFLDKSYPTIFNANIRRIWQSGTHDIGFIGFVRPSFGAIPPLAELQAQLWIVNLVGHIPQPIEVNHDYLLKPDPDRRLDYVVDHEAYAYRLACDMGSAPSFLQVLSFGRTTFLTWALGPNFNTKFRLVGPWKWEGAAAIMDGELWKVVRRRKGLNVWLSMSIVPIATFGILSLLFYITYMVKDCFTSVWLSRGVKSRRKPLMLMRDAGSLHANGARRASDTSWCATNQWLQMEAHRDSLGGIETRGQVT